MEHPLGRGISHIQVTAAVAVVILVGVCGWEIARLATPQNSSDQFAAASSASSSAEDSSSTSTAAVDPITSVSNDAIGELVGAYAGLQATGQYSSSSVSQVGGSIGQSLQTPISFTALAASDIKTTPNTSYQAMIDYRTALQGTLKPLLSNKEPEYEIFALYVQTKNASYLDQLRAAAQNYVAAASSTATLTVPQDAVSVQLGLVNSMNEFAATLDALAAHASDPIASSVLLENYNQAESDVMNAFQTLVTYEQSKHQ